MRKLWHKQLLPAKSASIFRFWLTPPPLIPLIFSWRDGMKSYHEPCETTSGGFRSAEPHASPTFYHFIMLRLLFKINLWCMRQISFFEDQKAGHGDRMANFNKKENKEQSPIPFLLKPSLSLSYLLHKAWEASKRRNKKQEAWRKKKKENLRIKILREVSWW